MIPPALKALAEDPREDVLLVCPGVVYRRDAIDWQHTGTPSQLDLWRITCRPMTPQDLDDMVARLVDAVARRRAWQQEWR
jgi:phenylalanyl-tRNA synthetase alpha chain